VPRMTIKAGLKEDRQEVVIEIRDEEKALGHIELDASTLDSFIQQLGKLRSGMTEQVSPTLDPFSRVETEYNPAWRVPDTHNAGNPGAMLCLRHPGFGWLGFLLDRERALQVSHALDEYSK
jgi:hypothetical protein